MTLRVYEPRAGTRVARALQLQLGVLDTARTAGITDEHELRRLIRDAYPWGERRNWPYRAWLRARKIVLERWRKRAFYPMAVPYADWPELAEWLAERGFREVAPDPGEDRGAPSKPREDQP